MRTFLRVLVLAPLALIFLAFAMANRQNVVVSFDPFSGGDIPSPQIVLPLFMVLIGATMFGVVLGGFATWLGQGRHRKALREARAQVQALRNEIESLRARANGPVAPASASTAIVPTRAA
ncbi:LapA family protein [Rhodoblastus acidophilus]|uniref:lipopolysaccharide assembly protein LapA domain-containing protein n=1 Tax=Candidatus Rhodoblastus alkanivorans TaxID=2954117 RepID=UPI001FAA9950|nr:LapA family protein [Candidatus Rhodoblastus alkanivorans]MCI4678062.1 LapA family protein [Candidatus Rhodoblastus alkanivorans]